MRSTEKIGTLCAMILFLGIIVGALPEAAHAADAPWRPTYDMAMRWVNFIILVAVIVKYGKEPIKDFLKLQKSEVVAELSQLEAEKNRILDEIKAIKAKGIENRTHSQELKDRLTAQGEIRKKQIIDQARRQSAIMLEAAGRKMENRIVQAKAGLKVELLDMAINQAMARLPVVITDSDNQRLLDDYMRSLHT
jgi:F-type H+-transporting ATPase subunit b